MLNLDTHILLFAIAGTATERERNLLSSAEWGIASIVFWEISMLVEKRRIRLDLDSRKVQRAFRRLHVWPLDLEVARTSTRLEVGVDPADRIIAATSLVHQVPLLTRDRSIVGSRQVPLA